MTQPTEKPLPDFLIIGAMKSGTTTLQAQLAAQPSIFMTTPKEPNFFSDDDQFKRGMQWYESLYADAQPNMLKGEASTHYTKLPTYPNTIDRLHDAVKAPKLIYMIRNPVERAVSHYIHEWTEGRMDRDVHAAFRRHRELLDYGRYAMQIAPFIERFGKDAVHLTSLEQIKADPHREFKLIQDHLQTPEPLVWDTEQRPQNVSAQRERRLPLHGLIVSNPIAKFLRRSLVPQSIRARIRESRRHDGRPEIPGDVRDHMADVFAKDQKQLELFFPDHPALSLCYKFLTR